MKMRRKPVVTKFARQTRFPVTPTPAALRRREEEAQLEGLKARLLEELVVQAEDAHVQTCLGRAASEAAALAWMTPYPVLSFPVLFQEKADQVRRYERHQKKVRTRSRVGLCEAA